MERKLSICVSPDVIATYSFDIFLYCIKHEISVGKALILIHWELKKNPSIMVCRGLMMDRAWNESLPEDLHY